MKTELFENDDVTVLDPAHPAKKPREKYTQMQKDTVLQKDPEDRSALSGMIPNRHFPRS